jgi:Tfp pilus assembly protein FimT
MQLTRCNRGFTLTDLLTACSIMALLVAVVVPSFTAFRQSTSLISVQREIMTALYIGRSNAIMNNAPRAVVITPPRKIEIKDGTGTTTYYARDLNVYGSTVSISGSSPVTITFDARGLLTSTTSVTLTITNDKSQTKTVTVYPTGKPEAS